MLLQNVMDTCVSTLRTNPEYFPALMGGFVLFSAAWCVYRQVRIILG